MAPRVIPARAATSSSDVRSKPFSPMIWAAVSTSLARVRWRLVPLGRGDGGALRGWLTARSTIYRLVFYTHAHYNHRTGAWQRPCVWNHLATSPRRKPMVVTVLWGVSGIVLVLILAFLAYRAV